MTSPFNHLNDPWTEAELTELRTKYMEGYSASEIARFIDAVRTKDQPRKTRSRNSIIGKIHRLKLHHTKPETIRQRVVTPKAKTTDPKPRKPKKTKSEAKARKPAPIVIPIFAGETDDRPLLETAWHPLPGSTPVPIEEHTNGCRWPIGEAPVHYCNSEAAENSPYCRHHKVIGVRPTPAKKKRSHVRQPPAFIHERNYAA